MSDFSADERIDAMMEAHMRTLYLLQETMRRLPRLDLGIELSQFFDDQYKAELGMIAERKKA